MDGGEPLVVEKLLAEGRMPTLAGIAARGMRVRAESPAPLLEECTWGTFLTGLPVGEFALAHFLRFDAETMGLAFQRELEVPGFWEHLPETARRVALDPPELHPVDGSSVESTCHWHAFGQPVHPPLYTSERLRRRLESHGRAPHLSDSTRMTTVAEDGALSQKLVASIRRRLATALDAGGDADFLCVGVQELHSATHGLGQHWLADHWRDPQPRVPELVESIYEAADEAMRPLVEAFAEDHVVVLFTHGMRPGNRACGILEGFLERAGYLVRAETTPEPSVPWIVQRMRTLVPEWIRLGLARRLPAPVQHRLASTRFRDSYRWDETRLVAPPAWTTGFLRANVRGREARGIVAPDELDQLLDEVTQLLVDIEDVDTGEPVVRSVVRAHEAYPGTRAHTLPDLLIEWNGRQPVTRVRHPRLGEWEGPLGDGHYWTSHSQRTLAFLAGPEVRHEPGQADADAEGFAPTLLGLCGVSAPPAMRGTPWDVRAR